MDRATLYRLLATTAALLAACALVACSGSHDQPSATASPSEVAGTQTTATPANVTLPQHAPDTRTGVADVDAVIAAMTSGDGAALAGRVRYEENSCGPARPSPACPDGDAPGTLVDSVSVQECSQYYVGKEDLPAFVADRVAPGNPYAVYRDTTGLRQLIFDRDTDGGIVSRITLADDGQIVGLAVSCISGKEHEPRRLDMLNEALTIYPYAPDRFILPPPK
jgi:hypothetical protein